jgi:hypothetical protein
MPPREMRRALMTGFGNARLAHRNTLQPGDLPRVARRARAASGSSSKRAAERAQFTGPGSKTHCRDAAITASGYGALPREPL